MRRLPAWIARLDGVRARAAPALRSPRAPAALAALVGLVALVPRWGFAVEEHPPRLYVFGDMAIYLERGVALTERARTAWDTFTPPGYPALLALLHAAAPGDLALVGACQAALGALTAALAALFAYRLDRSLAVAALAGLATALYFPLVFYAGFVLTETAFAFLLLLFAWLELRALEHGRDRGRAALGLAAGGALGLAVLVRPSLLAFLPWVAFRAARGAGPDRRVAGATLLACALVIAPVSAHTSWLLGRPALVATNGGVNFYLAHSACRSVRSTAGGEVVEVSTHYNRTHFERRCELPRPFLDEGAYYRAGLAEIAEHPGRLLRAWTGVAEGLGLAPRRAWPNQPFWPGSVEHEAVLDASSRLFVPLVLLPAVVHAIARARGARRGRGGGGGEGEEGGEAGAAREGGPGADAGARARGIAWAILASVVVVLYVYNGNPRVRVSSDPLALALAASAWAAGARRLLESFALALASRRAGPP
ncbi:MULTISPECIES: phospholipid carrier-dependent glycosyltransferase [Sorangium]|uniref:phospholipid carrier-dependent glycosyltransferase n=1 Tax=Sorangium TaxID=39643 RepID=UPI003D9C22BE